MPKEKHLPRTRPFTSPTDLWLWVLLIAGNALLSIPSWLFLDAKGLSINLEFTFALILLNVGGLYWQHGLRRILWSIFLLFFYVAIIYKSYAAVLQGVYQKQPNFYNDLPFIANGLPFLLSSLNFPQGYYFAFVVVVLIFFAFLAHFTYSLLVDRAERIGRFTQMLMVSLGAVLLLYSGFHLEMDAELPTGVDSLAAGIRQNIRASQASRQSIDSFLAQNPYTTYDYARYDFVEKPNIYIFFFESYGSVLYSQEHFYPAYKEIATDFEAHLANAGWGLTSALSTAPTWGGGSWMAYTSTLFGINVSEQSQYLALREEYQNIPYPNMGRYFHTQGYEYIWVVPIDRELPPKYQEADYAFYGADRWVTYDTLEYDGPIYGWGPSPPDQYTFGFIQKLVQEEDKPTFLFYLNQDSHYPWIPLPERVDDWQSLATSNAEGGRLSIEDNREISVFQARENYIAALEHSFQNITDFITTLDDPNALIVLIGDHQPPTVSKRDDGFETILHIISQNDDFLASFQEYEFEQGVLLKKREAQLAHEGFYSLFIRNFLAHYGANITDLPPYLADGLIKQE
jgi:hypothetical protein